MQGKNKYVYIIEAYKLTQPITQPNGKAQMFMGVRDENPHGAYRKADVYKPITERYCSAHADVTSVTLMRQHTRARYAVVKIDKDIYKNNQYIYNVTPHKVFDTLHKVNQYLTFPR